VVVLLTLHWEVGEDLLDPQAGEAEEEIDRNRNRRDHSNWEDHHQAALQVLVASTEQE